MSAVPSSEHEPPRRLVEGREAVRTALAARAQRDTSDATDRERLVSRQRRVDQLVVACDQCQTKAMAVAHCT
jgi:hypothetical protein